MNNRSLLFRTTPRFLIGPGVVSQVGEESKSINARNILIITDKGVLQAGVIDVIVDALKKSQLSSEIFSEVESDPRFEVVEKCLAVIDKKEVDLIIGVGGGSPMDIAKLISVMRTNGGNLKDYVGVGLIPKPGIPTIMSPV